MVRYAVRPPQCMALKQSQWALPPCWECSPLRVADHPLALHGQADHTPRAQVISPTAEAPNHEARFNSTGQPHPLRVVLGTNKRLPCVTLER